MTSWSCIIQHGQTPLHHAALSGHTQTVNALLENKAGVDIQDEVS